LDENQKVTLKDIGEEKEISNWAKKSGAKVKNLQLSSQFRCNGSDGYISWLDNTLQIKSTANNKLSDINYDFQIFDSPTKLRNEIVKLNKERNKARMVAGYCWDWKSKRDRELYDIEFEKYNFKMKWNLAVDGSLWIISPDSVNEIGCIHTCQGLELDYVGVIIGPDLHVSGAELVTDPAARAKSDKSLNGYKKALGIDPIAATEKADAIIRNTYRTLMTRGMKGCYVYFTDQATADYFKELLPA
jgi:DUF2075 family protein